MTQIEIIAAVCKLFCKGHTASEIKQLMHELHGVDMPREEPYQILSYAATQGWIRFVPQVEHALLDRMRQRHPWLEVDVVHTAVFDDVGSRAAERLLKLLREHARAPYSKKEVHIGFAGGHAMRKVARTFARLLQEPTEGLPARVVFHAMVAGFDVYEPSTDPNAFFTFFANDPALQVETGFVGLHAPPVVRAERFDELRHLPGVEEVYEAAAQLDIIVTSASLWSDEHSMLMRYMKRSPDSFDALTIAGCVADMLWLPLSLDGPIEIDTEIRAMTLLELTDLPAFIDDGKHVLLALGPCGGCNAPKGGVLDVLLRRKPRLITHLVADSRAARQYLQSD